jgi:ABC-type nitrate/sulfonate/bicarbonate transport system substrate-binding protein
LVLPNPKGGQKRETLLEVKSPILLRDLLAKAGLDPEDVGVVLGPDGPVRYDAAVPPPDRLEILPPLAAG